MIGDTAAPAYNPFQRAVGARGRPPMALGTTSQERIRPVTGTHVVRVQHEGIVTADAERSEDFSGRVLGFQVLPRPALSAGGYWLGTPGIFPQIHIIQSELVPPGPGAPISPRARHTCFEVADYDAMKATLDREGIKYIENTQPGRAHPDAVQRPRRQHPGVPADDRLIALPSMSFLQSRT